ncbi:MAG: glycosyltransferase family 4 protein [Deltaproteobacteria bacterium]|nr:glycosyltransferase family 4 protein [Deltaproteobacteria bacterium]
MRIALISRRFDAAGGGTERDLLVTAQILAAAGHQVTIYANEVRSRSGDLAVRQVAVLPLGRALRFLSFALRVAPMARREGAELVLSFARGINADIVRSGGSAHSSYIRAARRWQSATASAAMRLSLYHRAQIALERTSFKSSYFRCGIAVSELVRQDLLKSFALAPSKALTLYNGVDLKRFTPNHDKSLARRIRREFGIPEDSHAVAFIGHGFARKGLRFLLDAWPQVNSRTCLVVAGTDRAAAAYRRHAMQLGIGDRVIFIGARADVEHLFAAVDALVLPSLFEPFGNVVMEAMAAGLPALCSKLTGAAELIPRELRELVIDDPTDVGELARRVNLLPRLRSDASEAARAAAEQYPWQRYGTELLEIISGNRLLSSTS